MRNKYEILYRTIVRPAMLYGINKRSKYGNVVLDVWED